MFYSGKFSTVIYFRKYPLFSLVTFAYLLLFCAVEGQAQAAASSAAPVNDPLVERLDALVAMINTGDMESVKKEAPQLIIDAEVANDQPTYRNSLSLLFQAYCRTQKLAEALDLMNIEKEKAEKKKDQKMLNIIHNNLGTVYYQLGSYEKARINYSWLLESLEEEERKGNVNKTFWEHKAGVLSNLANVMILADSESALNYYKRAVATARKGGNEVQVAIFLYNLSWANFEINNVQLAKQYVDSALVMSTEIKHSYGIYNCNTLLGEIALKEGDQEKALEISLANYKQFKEGKENGWANRESFVLTNVASPLMLTLAERYKSLNNWSEAKKYGEEHYQFNKDRNNALELMKSTALLAEMEENLGNSKKAHAYLKEYVALKDSINLNEVKTEMLKKDQQLVVSAKEKDIAVLKEQASARQRAIWMMISICGLLLFSILMILNRFALRRSLHQEKSAKQAEIIAVKEQSLTHLALLNHSKTQLIDQLKGELKTIASVGEQHAQIDKVIHSLETKVNQEKDWEAFQRHFETIHPDFFKTLNATNGQLTSLDLKHCAFIKLNLSNSEVSRLLGVDPKSVQMAKYRLKKKLPLKTADSLTEFIRAL